MWSAYAISVLVSMKMDLIYLAERGTIYWVNRSYLELQSLIRALEHEEESEHI